MRAGGRRNRRRASRFQLACLFQVWRAADGGAQALRSFTAFGCKSLHFWVASAGSVELVPLGAPWRRQVGRQDSDNEACVTAVHVTLWPCARARRHGEPAPAPPPAPPDAPAMEEGFAAQLLGMGTQLRGGDAAGEGLPLGALSGLLADMLPTGEALQSLGRASSGPTWFSLAKSKTKTKTNPKTKTATDSNPAPAAGSPGASPQAGARRSPWDSFSSLSSANNGPASGGGGAPAPPAPAPGTANGTADGAVQTGSPCTPPPPPPPPSGAARPASGALSALWHGKSRGSEAVLGAPDGPPSLGPQPAPHGAAVDQDAGPGDGAPGGGGRPGRRR